MSDGELAVIPVVLDGSGLPARRPAHHLLGRRDDRLGATVALPERLLLLARPVHEVRRVGPREGVDRLEWVQEQVDVERVGRQAAEDRRA